MSLRNLRVFGGGIAGALIGVGVHAFTGGFTGMFVTLALCALLALPVDMLFRKIATEP